MTRTATGRRPAARSAARTTSRPTAASRRRAADAPPLRELWLAGLGAAAATGEAANGLVERLVEKGREAEPRVRASASQAVASLSRESRRLVGRVADDLGARAKVAVEAAFERLGVAPRKRAKNVLHRLGDLAEAIF